MNCQITKLIVPKSYKLPVAAVGRLEMPKMHENQWNNLKGHYIIDY